MIVHALLDAGILQKTDDGLVVFPYRCNPDRRDAAHSLTAKSGICGGGRPSLSPGQWCRSLSRPGRRTGQSAARA
jgi:hypothetical protein